MVTLHQDFDPFCDIHLRVQKFENLHVNCCVQSPPHRATFEFGRIANLACLTLLGMWTPFNGPIYLTGKYFPQDQPFIQDQTFPTASNFPHWSNRSPTGLNFPTGSNYGFKLFPRAQTFPQYQTFTMGSNFPHRFKL